MNIKDIGLMAQGRANRKERTREAGLGKGRV